MADICLKRLRREFIAIRKNPPANIRAAPLENNTLEWHYVLEGIKGSVYEGGWYHGVLIFPKDYPYKPPSVLMYTPNGRFQEKTRICLSMSDFHPETWNTSWSVATVLVGLQAFMMEDAPTTGSVVTTSRVKRTLAARSLENNCKNKDFCTLFPELVELYEEQRANGYTSMDGNNTDEIMSQKDGREVALNMLEALPFWAVLLALISLFSAAVYLAL